MWRAVVVMVVVAVVVEEGGGVATPLRPPVSRYAGISSSKQTVLLDPSTMSPRPPLTSTPTPPASSASPVVVGVTDGGRPPQKARLREGKYPLRRMNSSGLSAQRLRQQRQGVKAGTWRRGGAGGLAMGGRRIRPGGARVSGMTGPGKRRHGAAAASGGLGRRRSGQGRLQHRFASPRASSRPKSHDFLSRWHDSYSVSHKQHSTTNTTTAALPSSIPATKPSISKTPAPPTTPSVPPVIRAVAASVHDMTSRHYTASTNATSSTTRRGGEVLHPRHPSASSSRRPSLTTPAPRSILRATPGGTDILGSIQSIFKASGADVQSLASKKTVGNTAPPPLDVFAGIPVTSDFRPSARLEDVLEADLDPSAMPLNPVRLTSTLAPGGDSNLVPATPRKPQPQSLNTGNYLVHVGRPPPAESREGGIVLSDEGDEKDVVIGRPAALIQAPRDAQPRTSSTHVKGHTATPSPTRIDNHASMTTKSPTHIAAHNPAHAPAHVLTRVPTQRPTHGLAHGPAHVPAHVLTQFPGPQHSPPQVLLGSVPPLAPEDVRPLLDFIRNKYGEAVQRVPPSVTSLQALISSGRVPEMFRGPEVLQGIRRKAQVFQPLPIKRRGEAWDSKTELLKESKTEVEENSGGQFVAMSSLALLLAFCGYLLFVGKGSLFEPRGATRTLVVAVEEAKKGLNLLLQDLDEYEERLKNMKEEEENVILPQKNKEEAGPKEDIQAILKKMWDVAVPPEVRRVSGVLSYLSGNLKLANNSRTSKRLSSLFSKQDKMSFPSLSSLKENGLKFMNRVTENGVAFLIKNVKDSGFDLIQVNQSDSNANSSSILTKDRISSVVHSLLGSVVNSEPANSLFSHLWNPFESFTNTRTKAKNANQTTNSEPHQELKNRTKAMNVNQTNSSEPHQEPNARTKAKNMNQTTNSEPHQELKNRTKAKNVNQTTSSEPHQEPKNQTTTINSNQDPRTNTSEPKHTSLNHKTLNPKSASEPPQEPGNGGYGKTSRYSLEPRTGAKRPSELRKEDHNAKNQSVPPDFEPKEMTSMRTGEINVKNRITEDETTVERGINEADEEKVNEARQEDEDYGENERQREKEEDLEEILDADAEEMKTLTGKREKQEYLAVNEKNNISDKEQEKLDNRETYLTEENRKARHEDENSNTWIKKEEKEDGNAKVNSPTEENEVKERVKVILNNLLHVQRISSSTTSSSSSSPPLSPSSSSSFSPSRVSAYVDNIPLSPVNQNLMIT